MSCFRTFSRVFTTFGCRPCAAAGAGATVAAGAAGAAIAAGAAGRALAGMAVCEFRAADGAAGPPPRLPPRPRPDAPGGGCHPAGRQVLHPLGEWRHLLHPSLRGGGAAGWLVGAAWCATTGWLGTVLAGGGGAGVSAAGCGSSSPDSSTPSTCQACSCQARASATAVGAALAASSDPARGSVLPDGLLLAASSSDGMLPTGGSSPRDPPASTRRNSASPSFSSSPTVGTPASPASAIPSGVTCSYGSSTSIPASTTSAATPTLLASASAAPRSAACPAASSFAASAAACHFSKAKVYSTAEWGSHVSSSRPQPAHRTW
eukprot:scaffold4907_cov122-Isochrysis_galbana.AAC.17